MQFKVTFSAGHTQTDPSRCLQSCLKWDGRGLSPHSPSDRLLSGTWSAVIHTCPASGRGLASCPYGAAAREVCWGPAETESARPALHQGYRQERDLTTGSPTLPQCVCRPRWVRLLSSRNTLQTYTCTVVNKRDKHVFALNALSGQIKPIIHIWIKNECSRVRHQYERENVSVVGHDCFGLL